MERAPATASERGREIAVVAGVGIGAVGSGKHQAAALQRVFPAGGGRCSDLRWGVARAAAWGSGTCCLATGWGLIRQKEAMGGDVQNPWRPLGQHHRGGGGRAADHRAAAQQRCQLAGFLLGARQRLPGSEAPYAGRALLAAAEHTWARSC